MTYRWAREPWDTKLSTNKCIIGSLFMKLVTVVEESTQIKWSRGELQVSRSLETLLDLFALSIFSRALIGNI